MTSIIWFKICLKPFVTVVAGQGLLAYFYLFECFSCVEHQKADWIGIHEKICQLLIPLRTQVPFLSSEEERVHRQEQLLHRQVYLILTGNQNSNTPTPSNFSISTYIMYVITIEEDMTKILANFIAYNYFTL